MEIVLLVRVARRNTLKCEIVIDGIIIGHGLRMRWLFQMLTSRKYLKNGVSEASVLSLVRKLQICHKKFVDQNQALVKKLLRKHNVGTYCLCAKRKIIFQSFGYLYNNILAIIECFT